MNEAVSPGLESVVPSSAGEGMEARATDGNPAPNADARVSSKMELLIRREQAALHRERQAKQREYELDQKMKAFADKEARITEFDSVKNGNSKKALDLLGLNYDELTQSVLKDGEIPPEVQIRRLEEKLEKFKEEQSGFVKSQEEKERQHVQAQEQRAITDFKTSISDYVKENSGRYELISFENKQEEIFKEIDDHYAKTIDEGTGIGVVMSMKEAADKVEERLEQKYNKARELKKIQAFLAQSKPGIPQGPKLRENRLIAPPKTLTNQMTATPQKRAKILTDEERVQKAIAYARGLRP